MELGEKGRGNEMWAPGQANGACWLPAHARGSAASRTASPRGRGFQFPPPPGERVAAPGRLLSLPGVSSGSRAPPQAPGRLLRQRRRRRAREGSRPRVLERAAAAKAGPEPPTADGKGAAREDVSSLGKGKEERR